MSTVYERAQEALLRIQDEINLLEKEMYELRTFLRVHEKLTEPGISVSGASKFVVHRDSDVAESNSSPAETEPETETETLAKSILADHPQGMRVRELYEKMVRLGYEPAGKNPNEVLRMRLARSRFFRNEGGVFSLRQEA